MRKVISILLLIAAGSAGFALSPAKFSTAVKGIDPTNANLSQKKEEQLTGINGAENPELIPDEIAYEFFLRSLVPNLEEGQIANTRVRAFAEQVSKDDDDVYTLLLSAQNFEAKVSALDKKVQKLKDASWPEPTQAVMNQLADLQRQKEILVQDSVNTLFSDLDKNDVRKMAKAATKIERAADKVSKHIQNRVKHGITASTPPLPSGHTHIGTAMPFGAFFGLASFPTTTQRMGEGYSYSNVTNYIDTEQAVGYGATAERYTSYGHTYQVTATLSFDDGRQVSTTAPYAGGFASPYLQTQTLYLSLINPTTQLPYDRFARVDTRGALRCIYAVGATFLLASSFFQEQAPAQVMIEQATKFNPACITSYTNSSADLNVIVSASSRVPNPTTVEVEAVRITPEPPSLDLSPSDGHITLNTISANSLKTFTFALSHPGTNNSSGQATYRTRIISVTENDPNVITKIGGQPVERTLSVLNPCPAQ